MNNDKQRKLPLAVENNHHHQPRKSSISALKSLLPIVQESYRIGRTSSKSNLDNSIKTVGNACVQCDNPEIISNNNNNCNMVSLKLASWLSLPNDAVFLDVQTRRLIEPRNTDQRIRIESLLRSSSFERTKSNTNLTTAGTTTSTTRRVVVYLQEIGVQTCELDSDSARLIARLESVFYSSVGSTTTTSGLEPRTLAGLIEKLSNVSRRRLIKCILTSHAPSELCERLLKMT